MDAASTGRCVGVGVVTREGTGRSEAGKPWYRARVSQWGKTRNFMCDADVYNSIPEGGGTMAFCARDNQKPTASSSKKGNFINELYELELEAVGVQAIEIIGQIYAAASGGADPLAPASEGGRRARSQSA